jgi:hypothetical protein
MNGAVVISWGTAVRGREAKSLEVFGKAIEHFDALAKVGRIHGHQEFIARTGPSRGFMLVTGDYDELSRIQNEDEVLDLTIAGATICEDFSVALYAGGTVESTTETVTRYAKVLNDLGYLTPA